MHKLSSHDVTAFSNPRHLPPTRHSSIKSLHLAISFIVIAPPARQCRARHIPSIPSFCQLPTFCTFLVKRGCEFPFLLHNTTHSKGFNRFCGAHALPMRWARREGMISLCLCLRAPCDGGRGEEIADVYRVR
jgi:hypothetical protein